jgi:hypothetical protein
MPTMEKMPSHPCSCAPPPLVAPKGIDDEGPVEMIPEQEAPVLHEVILVDTKPEMS